MHVSVSISLCLLSSALARHQPVLSSVDLVVAGSTHSLSIEPGLMATFQSDRPHTSYRLSDTPIRSDEQYSSPVFRDLLGGPMVVPPRFVVRFTDSTTRVDALATIEALGTVIEADFGGLPNAYLVRSLKRTGLQVIEDTNTLDARSDTLYAEPDLVFTGRSSSIPNDLLFPLAWGLDNTGQDIVGLPGLAGFDMNVLQAWEITRGDASIITVVIDNGVEQDHPDIHQMHGRDFAGYPELGGGPGNECDSHGTPVAGCISGIANNIIGATGISPDTVIASARSFVSYSSCSGAWSTQMSSTVSVLQWAESIGARVTNNSNVYGFVSTTIADKYAQTREGGMIHFASAGNNGSRNVAYPASLPTVNAMGAVINSGVLAPSSNHGNKLFAVAPGDNVMTTDRTGEDGYGPTDYSFVSGTSFASPYAAGVAALLLSIDPTLEADEVESILATSARPIGDPFYYGHGLVDAGAALAMIGPCGLADTVPPFGVTDLEDLDAFVNAFLASETSADFVPPVGVVDLDDLDAFIEAFLAGCP